MFNNFKIAVQRQFNEMKKQQLFRVLVDKDLLWETYLKSFPEGTNPTYRTRTEHDCQCCRQFIRSIGNMISIVEGKIVSIWDCKTGDFYQEVSDAMSTLIKSCPIDNMFLHNELVVGTDKNYQQKEDGTVLTWEHFFIQLPSLLVVKGIDIGPKLSEFRSTHDVMLRSLKEITVESIDTVLELIGQNSLYRGEEHKFVITEFFKVKKKFDKLNTDLDRDIFCWAQINLIPVSLSRIRNTVIGTLLVDLSEGKDMEHSVSAFESKVAPTNYKRPTALVTKVMIENARKKVEELGLISALERRYAVIEDITINNILFADREAKKKISGSIFDDLSAQTADKVKKMNEIEEIPIERFVREILPKAESLDVMFENKHSSNLVSLIAPSDLTAKHMFKWPNPFSWSYAGELTDSIKERVKTAGGRVDGDLRCSLSWFNFDDLDLHMIEPKGGIEIYYSIKRSSYTLGNLDVDMNAGNGTTRKPVENICYPDRKRMIEGVYTLKVNQFCRRETTEVGFDAEIEYDGCIYSFSYPKPLRGKENVTVAEIKYTHKDGFEIIKSLPSSQSVRKIWGIPTQTFHKVNVMMLSPNYWNEKAVGNKHYFFMIDGCKNEGKARGFFNEFLTPELDTHRKVFEMVGSKMRTDESDNQLSGIGFSSTQRNSVLCKVKGNFTRILKIIF